MLNEQAIGLRTKAVKALTMIVSVDPSILARVIFAVFLYFNSVFGCLVTRKLNLATSIRKNVFLYTVDPLKA